MWSISHEKMSNHHLCVYVNLQHHLNVPYKRITCEIDVFTCGAILMWNFEVINVKTFPISYNFSIKEDDREHELKNVIIFFLKAIASTLWLTAGEEASANLTINFNVSALNIFCQVVATIKGTLNGHTCQLIIKYLVYFGGFQSIWPLAWPHPH